MKRLFWACACALALQACSGSALPNIAPGATADDPGRQSTSGLPVTLSIEIPVTTRTQGRAQYISSATQSIKVVLKSTTTGLTAWNQTYNATPTTGGCTTSGSTHCTFTLYLAPDTYSESIITYSGINGNGNELSINQSSTMTVKKGVANAITTVLYAIPASWQLASSGTYTTNGYVLNGIAPTGITWKALDASGLTIQTFVSGAPSSFTHAVSGTGNVTITGGNSSTIYVQPTNNAVASSTITVTAVFPDPAVCTQSIAVCSYGAQVQTSATQRLFVANSSGNTVTIYDAPYSSPTTTISGLTAPTHLAFDSSNDLFVGNSSSGTVDEYAPPYTGSPVNTFTPGSKVAGLAVDSSGNVFISDGSSLYKYATPYSSTYSTLITGGVNDFSIAPSGEIAYINSTASIEVAPPPYTSPVSNFSSWASSTAALEDRAFDSSSNLYMVDPSWYVYSYPPPGYFSGPHFIASTSQLPTHIAVDSNNIVYFSTTAAVYEYTSSGTNVASAAIANTPFVSFDTAREMIGSPSSTALDIFNIQGQKTVITTGINGPTAVVAL